MNIKVTLLSGPPCMFKLQGRLGWTMAQLFNAGPPGVTTIEPLGSGWSAYVHDLRELGIQIETQMEPHKGAYPSHHARYRLACDVLVASCHHEVGAMNPKHSQPPPIAVRRIMRKHGLPKPSARSYALLAYGEAALHGEQ